MSKLVWDATGERRYETGTKNGVLYPQVNGAYPTGVAWNGLTAFTKSPEGAEPTDIYADDIKYLTLRSAENFKATIEAYTYPDEFNECLGISTVALGAKIGQQPRKSFGFSCVTTVGNDTELDNYGEKIHLVWGASASPSEENYQTINDSPEAITFSWEIDTIPVEIKGFKPTAYMVIDSTLFKTEAEKAKLKALKDILYGVDADDTVTPAVSASDPRLPMPNEIVAFLNGN